jgi:tetratricopeptide (TPR) repeat protein
VASSGWLAFALAERGEFEAAHIHGEEAERAAEEFGNPYGAAIARTMRALVWLRQGRLEEAARLLEEALDACRAKRLTVWQPIPSVLLGVALTHLGRVQQGLPLLEAGVALTEQLGVRAYLALWTTHLAEGHLALGQLDRARELGERALSLAQDCKEVGHQAWALWLIGEVAAAGGPDAVVHAEAAFAEAMTIATARGMRPLLVRCHLGLSAAYHDRAMPARASSELEAATRLAASIGVTLRPSRLLGTRGIA